MTFAEKTAALAATIATEAAALGLKFVDGPGPASVASPSVSLGRTNGQERGVVLLAVAEQ